jgi:macrolide transport system ATP-binding/permease protein
MWNPLIVLRRRRRPADDFAREVEAHIAIEAERLVAEGRTVSEAAAEARRRFGNVGAAQERFHDARTFVFLESVGQDIRHGLRVLRRAPIVTGIAVLSLALGIGANTAVFTFVNAVLFKPLAVQDPARLVWVSTDPRFRMMSYPDVARFRTRPDVFAGVAAVSTLDRSNVAIDHQPADQRSVRVHLVTGDYFALFGVHAAKGRTLTMDDERSLDAHPVVVISDRYWRSRFDHIPDVLGHTLTLNATIFTVVGVAPPPFTGDELGEPADLWIPMMMQSEVMIERPNIVMTPRMWVRMLARLAPGMTTAQAATRATQFYRTMLLENAPGREPLTPAQAAAFHITLNSEARGYAASRRDAGDPIVVAWVIVVLVLAIACVNVTALLLVRAGAREREMTTRLAIGATSGRIARLMLTEGALIGGAASVLGIAVAFVGVRWLDHVAASGMTTYQLSLVPDARVLALTLGVSLVAMFGIGLVPARRAAQLSVVAGAGRRASVTSRARLGKTLAVGQVALALVLLIAAGLFTRTLAELERQDMGFDRDHMLEAFTAPEQANISGERLAGLYDAIVQRVGALPDVRAVVVSSRGLLTQYSGMVRTTVPGHPTRPDDPDFVAYNYTMPGFFRAAGMRLVAGRDFDVGDVADHQRVAVISESMARHYFGTPNAIGMRYGTARDEGAPIEVVGIVRDAKDASLRDADIDMMYLPYRQNTRGLTQMRAIVQTQGDPAALASAVRRILHDLEPTLAVIAVEPIRVQMGRSIAMERFTALVSMFFGAVALLLAALGMFAMVSHAVVTRTSEIGIRMALGGTRAGVLRMIVRENLVIVGAGIALGVVLAVFAARAITARLFGVSPIDASTFAGAAAVMVVAALAAVMVPATRATRVDPAITLRHE